MKVIEDNIWNKFKKIETLSSNKYSSYYKVKILILEIILE